MVVNPFIWGRMHVPGRQVPFLFQEFAPQQQQSQPALEAVRQPATTAQLQPRQILEAVLSIASQLLGAEVGPEPLNSISTALLPNVPKIFAWLVSSRTSRPMLMRH